MHVGEQLRLRINHSKEVWTVVEPNRRIICTNGFVTSCPSSSVVAFVERQVVGDLMIFRLPNVSRSAASNQIPASRSPALDSFISHGRQGVGTARQEEWLGNPTFYYCTLLFENCPDHGAHIILIYNHNHDKTSIGCSISGMRWMYFQTSTFHFFILPLYLIPTYHWLKVAFTV